MFKSLKAQGKWQVLALISNFHVNGLQNNFKRIIYTVKKSFIER